MPYSGLSLEGKSALVTGSARGIGRALAVGLAEAGANVAVSDMPERLEEARETQEMVEKLGVKSSTYLLDVLDVGGISTVMEQVSQDLDGLDIVINNAGVRVRKYALEVTEDDWDFVVDTNLKGVFFCAQAAARQRPHYQHRLPVRHRCPRRPRPLLRQQRRGGQPDESPCSGMGPIRHNCQCYRSWSNQHPWNTSRSPTNS